MTLASERRLGDEEEFNRTFSKVNRSLEKLRRLGIRVLELYTSSSRSVSSSSTQIDGALHRLLLACVICLQNALSDQVCVIFVFFGVIQ